MTIFIGDKHRERMDDNQDEGWNDFYGGDDDGNLIETKEKIGQYSIHVDFLVK